jgi:hypothetical protein
VTPRAVAVSVSAAVAIGASILAPAAPAFADPQAEAVVLFDQGIKDMKAGRLDKACSELQASLQLVKDSGTKGALARCQGRAGRVASAWLLWRELADTAPTSELRGDAAAQASKLERRLPRYTLKLAGPTPGLVVQINGRDVPVEVPVPVPIDPGTVSVTASGRDGDRATTRIWSHDYDAVEGEILAIEIPVLEPLPVARPARPPRPVQPAEPDGSAEIAASRHRRHVVALVLGGVAVGAGAGGAVFGLDARSRYNDARRLCGPGSIDHCAANQVGAAQSRVDASRTSARWADGLAIGAGAAAIAAVIVWATAPSLEPRRVAVAPSVGGHSVCLVVGGAF